MLLHKCVTAQVCLQLAWFRNVTWVLWGWWTHTDLLRVEWVESSMSPMRDMISANSLLVPKMQGTRLCVIFEHQSSSKMWACFLLEGSHRFSWFRLPMNVDGLKIHFEEWGYFPQSSSNWLTLQPTLHQSVHLLSSSHQDSNSILTILLHVYNLISVNLV